MMNSKSGAISKRDIWNTFLLSIGYQAFVFNYETMQSAGWVLSLSGCLNKIYADDPELLKEKYNKYFQFYNTNPILNPAITGVVLSMEETKAEGVTDTCLALRTGLMGTLAGLGDSLFWITGRTVFCSIAGYMALEGSPAGLIVTAIMCILIAVLRYVLFDIGYSQGANFLLERADQFRNLTNCAAIIGLCVIGAMIPSTVTFSTNLTFAMGDATATLDGFLETILPYLWSILITTAVFFGLKKKGMTTVRMIWLILIICVVLGFFGIV
ncbi:MAG: PTS system mannose/fructose/sorbose family transporter subunit IID [Lachnospiraceae bacterium]|nr:PTS system mannose/fructose/sorbose family transporter subunit IID [Lachnospiraceae bacterium]